MKFENSLKKHLQRYPDLSYANKLRFFIFLICGILLLCFICVNLFFWNLLAEKEYSKSQTELFYTSQNIFRKLEEPKTFTYNLVVSDSFQDELSASNQASVTNQEKYHISATLKDLIRNVSSTQGSSIRSVYLFNKKEESLGNVVLDRDHLLPEVSLADAISALPDSPSPGFWYFSDEISQAIYVQKIFSSDELKLDYQGIIIFLIDTSFIKSTYENGANFNKNNIYILSNAGKNLVTTFDEKNKTAHLTSLVNKGTLTNIPKRNVDINGKNYFVVSTASASDTFQSTYLVLNNEIISQVTKIEIIFFILLLILILPLYQLIKKFTQRLTDPIIELADQMHLINTEEDLRQLKALTPQNGSNDEVAILYHGFVDMATQLSQLIEENYKSKILSQEMEFKALQAQLDPHFLYNTLDSIYWLAIENDQDKIAQMALSLALLFRKKINNTSEIISLADELQLVDAYTSIQMIRFEERATYTKKIEIADIDLVLPKFLIQPLVENAFKYAVEKSAQPINIVFWIHEVADYLLIEVIDDGVGFAELPPKPSQSGIGLANIKSRLKLFFGDEADLIITSQSFVKTAVTLKIPKDQLRRSL